MVRTRGGSSQADRVRPTVSVRCRGSGGDNIPKTDDVEENVAEEVNVAEDMDARQIYVSRHDY